LIRIQSLFLALAAANALSAMAGDGDEASAFGGYLRQEAILASTLGSG
jgi:hypothetical protein